MKLKIAKALVSGLAFSMNNEYRQRSILWPPDSKNVNFNKSLVNAFFSEEVSRSDKSLKGPMELKGSEPLH
jgi:hypothetical protein